MNRRSLRFLGATLLLLVLGPDGGARTLHPEPLREGETLRFVVDGVVRTEPSPEAVIRARHRTGDEVTAARLLTTEGREWIEISSGGYVEACRLDRPPEPVSGDLPVGREGLAAGRVLPEEYVPGDLVRVPVAFRAPGYEGRRMRLRAGAVAAFRSLIEAAATKGHEIRIFSAHRSAAYQRRLYLRAIARDPGQIHSAAPGRSDHRLGTAVDVAVSGVPTLSEALASDPAGIWIAEHGEEHGIVVPFSRERCAGRDVAHEPWHLRWVGEAVEDESAW